MGAMLLLLRYLGAIIGRTCDRIAEGKFSLEGADYQVPFSIWEWSDKNTIQQKHDCNYSWTSTTSSALVVVSMVVKGASFSLIRFFHSWSQWKGQSKKKSFKVHILVTETSEAGTSACGRGGWIKTQPLSPSGKVKVTICALHIKENTKLSNFHSQPNITWRRPRLPWGRSRLCYVHSWRGNPGFEVSNNKSSTSYF